MVREKEKLRSDLDKAEKLKSLMASEVDDHHAAIERRNEYNLRCDWWGQVPPYLAAWPGQRDSAGLPSWLHLAGVTCVAKPKGKQDFSQVAPHLCDSVSILGGSSWGSLRDLMTAYESFLLTGNWMKSTRSA